MLIQSCRPKSYKEVKGNEHIKKALINISKDPNNKPVSMIFQGLWGSGKTTLARIFVRSLNCETKTGEACNKCKSCLELLKGSSLYQELDCSVVGNVEDLNAIKDGFSYSFMEGYRVIVFDEFHLASKQSQGALLKLLEDPPKNIFFIFATTDPEKILPTILSRSLLLDFNGLSDSDIEILISEVAKNENLELSDEIKSVIVRRADGHARDSLSLLEKYKIYGTESFLSSTQLLDLSFRNFIAHTMKGAIPEAKKELDFIMSNPLSYIEQDFDKFIIYLSNKTFIEKTAPQKVKTFIFEFLKHKKYLNDSNTWYIFFLYSIDLLK